MQIEITEITRIKKLVDVEFPIYRRHDMDGDGWSTTLFTRVNADLNWVTVEIKRDELEIEIGSNYRFTNSSGDYLIGRGEYRCTSAEFNEAFEKAKVFFAKASLIADGCS